MPVRILDSVLTPPEPTRSAMEGLDPALHHRDEVVDDDRLSNHSRWQIVLDVDAGWSSVSSEIAVSPCRRTVMQVIVANA
jgi:hypothetical protein